MKLYQIAAVAHFAAGAVALCAFWLNALLRKGSRGHRGVGRGYVIAMLAVVLTGAPLAASAFARGQAARGLFLTYLLSLTAAACWSLWASVRAKQDFHRYTGLPFRALAWSNLLLGVATLVAGVLYKVPLFMGFSLVGIVAGSVDLRYASRSPQDAKWWLVQHYTSAVGCGVATHIAFIVLGLSRLLPSSASLVTALGWFGPLVIAPVALILLNRKYRGRRPRAEQASGIAVNRSAP